MSSQNNIRPYNKTTFQIQYEINSFNINLTNISCYSLGNNNLIFQSSTPPYDITFLLFTQTLQSSQLLSFSHNSIKTIVANETSLHFLCFNGSLYSWESSMRSKQVSPILNASLKKAKIIDIAQSEDCTICFDSYMNVYCWGNISHLTGQGNHHSSIPVKLSKEVYRFPSALTKIVCGEKYAMFLNLTGEVCYCGLVQGHGFDDGNNDEDVRLRYIDMKGFYNVFGGKNIAALYNNNKDSVVVYNEEIGLIEIRIKNYYIVKKTMIKFIENVMFLEGVNDKQEKFAIEIYLKDIGKVMNDKNKDNDMVSKKGVIRTYRNDSNSVFLWSPYYHKMLSFSNHEKKMSCLSLVEEKPFNINIKALVKSQKEQQRHCQNVYHKKKTIQYEQLHKEEEINNRKEDYDHHHHYSSNDQNHLHKELSDENKIIKPTPYFSTNESEKDSSRYRFEPYNPNPNKIITYNNNVPHTVQKLELFKQNILGDIDNKTHKYTRYESSSEFQNHPEESYTKLKKMNHSSKSFHKPCLDQVHQYYFASPSNHNHFHKYPTSNTIKASLNEITNRYTKEVSSSIIKKVNRFRESNELFPDNRQCKSSGRMRSIHQLIKSKPKEIDKHHNQRKHNKLIEGLAECINNDLYAPKKRNSNRNIKARLKECSDKLFKSHQDIINKATMSKENANKDKVVTIPIKGVAPLNRISTESCILRYLKEKKMSKDKTFI